jgi:endonuclease IV
MLILGVHVAKSSHVLDSGGVGGRSMDKAIIEDLEAYGLNACQIFTYGPANLKRTGYEAEKIRNVTKDIDLTVHSAYMSVGIWTKKHMRGIIVEQLKSAAEIGAWGWVLHISKLKPNVIANVVREMKKEIEEIGVVLLLEMIASKGDDETYETPEKLNGLIDAIGGDGSYWGITVDTAHIFAAGFNCSKYKPMQKWLLGVKEGYIKQFHLNGSASTLGSGKDKHAIPMGAADNIWRNIEYESSGLRAIVEYAVERNIPMIMEINEGPEAEVRKIVNLISSHGK